jgi:opacity protein-like surface antigen
MKSLSKLAMLFAILTAAAMASAQVSTQTSSFSFTPILLGTTGACNNLTQGGPCTQQSTLVQVDPTTGALIKTIGQVGYTVNGLAWDRTNGKLYASTALGDTRFHGLITIDPNTGVGTPVNASVINFGLAIDPGTLGSPVHSITVDFFGNMAGWYDEFGSGVTDTFVRINKTTGVATEFTGTGINTSQNGLSFSDFNILWNIDSPKTAVDGTVTQTAYLLNPLNGKPLLSRPLSPPIPAAIGDFSPTNNLYYGLNFTAFDPTHPTFIVTVNLLRGTVTTVAQTVDNLHTLAFTKAHP